MKHLIKGYQRVYLVNFLPYTLNVVPRMILVKKQKRESGTLAMPLHEHKILVQSFGRPRIPGQFRTLDFYLLPQPRDWDSRLRTAKLRPRTPGNH